MLSLSRLLTRAILMALADVSVRFCQRYFGIPELFGATESTGINQENQAGRLAVHMHSLAGEKTCDRNVQKLHCHVSGA